MRYRSIDPDMDYGQWARIALSRPLREQDYQGISYEEASRKAQAICRVAGETGQTVEAYKHLGKYVETLSRRRRAA